MNNEMLIRVEEMTKNFPITSGTVNLRQVGTIQAVTNVSFEIRKGETLGLVGESGCGKSTLGRTILQLHRPTSGRVFYKETDLTLLEGDDLRRMRRNMQIIFQDPHSSLNPRHKVGNIISEPLLVHGIGNAQDRENRVQELLRLVGLSPRSAKRYPHEFSGGQAQRIGVARALALQPEFIVCDEPISALDTSIQAQVVNLLRELQAKFGLTYLFIAHDLSMVRQISDRTVVMYLGTLAELATRDELYSHPLHPYTQALLSAVPIPDPQIEAKREPIALEGEVPSPANPPSGCRFHTRCPIAVDMCKDVEPDWREVAPEHWVACHLV